MNADDFFSNAISAGLAGDGPLAPGGLKQAGMELAFRQKWPEGFTDWITLANSLTPALSAGYLVFPPARLCAP